MFNDWERELIESLRVARLATVGYDGRPHIVPVCYAYHAGHFYISVDEKPKRGPRVARVRNIEGDPRVSLLFDRYDDDWTQLAWVRVDGLAAVFARGDYAPAALEALRARYPQYGEMALERLPLIVVTPERVASWRWGEGG